MEPLNKKQALQNLVSSLETDSDLMGYSKDGSFLSYKKAYILFKPNDPRFSYEPSEIYLLIEDYYILKCLVEETKDHFIEEANVYLFFSIQDFFNTIREAVHKKLF